MTFHAKDGLYFDRAPDGAVTVSLDDPFTGEDMQIVLTPASWASVMAAMCKAGETGESFQAAMVFHTGQPL